MRLVLTSDTHGSHEQLDLPAGDVLIHAGDFCAHGTQDETLDFLDWFAAQPFRIRLCIAGNHDLHVEREPAAFAREAKRRDVIWLNDSGCDIEGLPTWGSPITPRFFDWAFMRDPGADIAWHWAQVPDATRLLITHGPPFGVLDKVQRTGTPSEEHVGCPSLHARVRSIRPLLHVFGHIHEGYGDVRQNETRFVNVCAMDAGYRLVNRPKVIDLQV